MLNQITAFLDKSPGCKAREIAAQLGFDRAEVNKLLHQHDTIFRKNLLFEWFLTYSTIRIDFSGKGWLVARNFEDALQGTSLLDSEVLSIVFSLKNEAKPMLDFLARLLALSNQLVHSGKKVTIDFEESKSVLTYLDRVGFFGVLNSTIDVLPKRPIGRRAKEFKGKNDGVIEFRTIDPSAPNQGIPTLLQNSFVSCAGKSYSQAAFTMLSELFGNVLEHSNADLPGFAGLQFYRNSKKIQVVISDNGLGIVGTLAPVLPKKYPDVADLIAKSEHAGVALLSEVFKTGNLSQVDTDGRGIGIWRSGDVARLFRAKISVRQSDFELRVYHDHNGVQFDHRTNLSLLEGTHICFEFKLDSDPSIA